MKKFLILSVLAASACVGFAQGSVVYFGNNVSFVTTASAAGNGHTDRLVYYTDNTALIGTNWYAQLYYATGSGVTASSLQTISGDTPAKFRASGTTAAGTWNPSNVPKTLSTVNVGTTVTLQVRVWDGSLYQTYAAAADPTSLPAGPHITGESATFDYVTQPSTGSPVFMEGLQSFTLHPAPEPSTIALGLLGAASLLVVRRRK
jgi:hypothetical protein